MNEATFYVPAMVALAVITVCFNNIAVAVTFQRDSGVLKRIDGTPLPSASFFGARILHAVLVSALLVVITAGFGRAFYSADIPTGITLLRMLVMLAVGAAAFCALGFAISSVIPNADASLPIVNVIILPLLFLSGVFIPLGNNPPAWMLWVGRIFPVRHFLVRHAGRVPRRPVQLDRRPGGSRLGPGRTPLRDPLLPLGTPDRLTPEDTRFRPITNPRHAGPACSGPGNGR